MYLFKIIFHYFVEAGRHDGFKMKYLVGYFAAVDDAAVYEFISQKYFWGDWASHCWLEKPGEPPRNITKEEITKARGDLGKDLLSISSSAVKKCYTWETLGLTNPEEIKIMQRFRILLSYCVRGFAFETEHL